jgi:hypothetical protein
MPSSGGTGNAGYANTAIVVGGALAAMLLRSRASRLKPLLQKKQKQNQKALKDYGATGIQKHPPLNMKTHGLGQG